MLRLARLGCSWTPPPLHGPPHKLTIIRLVTEFCTASISYLFSCIYLLSPPLSVSFVFFTFCILLVSLLLSSFSLKVSSYLHIFLLNIPYLYWASADCHSYSYSPSFSLSLNSQPLFVQVLFVFGHGPWYSTGNCVSMTYLYICLTLFSHSLSLIKRNKDSTHSYFKFCSLTLPTYHVNFL